MVVTLLRELKWRSGPWTFKLKTYTNKEYTTWAIVYQLFYTVEWNRVKSNVMCFNIWMGLTQSNGFNKLKEKIRLVYFRVSIFILRSTVWNKNYEQRQSFLVKCIEWSRWSGIALILVKISLFCDWSGICNYVEFSRGLLLLLFWWYLYLFSALLFRLTKIYPCKFIFNNDTSLTLPFLPLVGCYNVGSMYVVRSLPKFKVYFSIQVLLLNHVQHSRDKPGKSWILLDCWRE